MIDIQIESFLGKASFVTLFLMMIVYWIQASFTLLPKFNKIGLLGTSISNFLLLILLIVRWVNYGHFPLSNLYESLIFLSWTLTFFQIILEKISKNIYLGVIISPMALFTTSFATFSLSKDMQKATVLVPALQSNWLMMHVTIMMLSYAALICGSLLAICFLILTYGLDLKKINTTSEKLQLKSIGLNLLEPNKPSLVSQIIQTATSKKPLFYSKQNMFFNEKNLYFLNKNKGFMELYQEKNLIDCSAQSSNEVFLELANILDNLSYRALGIGFPLLTIGILSGAVWANEAWGAYWSWDPKETWAFITWLIFAIYLHSRIVQGWQGKKPAIIASLGFGIIWICYLGVNLLGKGLHSYGWIQ